MLKKGGKAHKEMLERISLNSPLRRDLTCVARQAAILQPEKMAAWLAPWHILPEEVAALPLEIGLAIDGAMLICGRCRLVLPLWWHGDNVCRCLQSRPQPTAFFGVPALLSVEPIETARVLRRHGWRREDVEMALFTGRALLGKVPRRLVGRKAAAATVAVAVVN